MDTLCIEASVRTSAHEMPPATPAAAYWEARARQFAAHGSGLGAVCSYGMPAFYNRYIDGIQRRALRPYLPRATPKALRVLDIGCGVGRWSLELARRGHRVTGVDLSQRMIEEARRRAADARVPCSFSVGDTAVLDLDQRFDLILCVTVVQHILEPARAAMAMVRMAEHLAPGGRLILLEAAPTAPTRRCDTAVFHAHPLSWYRATLRAAGLTLRAQRGVDPTPLKTWLMPHYRELPRALAQSVLAVITAVSWPIDWAFGGCLATRSWHKVLVAERSGES